MPSPVEEIAFLTRSDHRVGVLEALDRRPADRADLQEATGASKPTIGRVLGDLEERKWLVRNGRTYELTPLGTFITGRVSDLCDAMEAERTLREVASWLPCTLDGFTLDLFSHPVVSYPGPGYPYEPLERVEGLISGADRMRGFGAVVLKASALETAREAILDGLDFEFVYSPSVLEQIVAWNPDAVAELQARDNCTTFLHDDLPEGDCCGLAIYDDRVGLCCHDPQTGVLKAVVDTDSPDALDWAESLYDRYRGEAERLG